MNKLLIFFKKLFTYSIKGMLEVLKYAPLDAEEFNELQKIYYQKQLENKKLTTKE